MGNTAEIVLYSFVSGFTVFLGGLLSWLFEGFGPGEIKEEIRHGATAFGGGILLAACAFVLTPNAIGTLALTPLILLFVAGSLCFFVLDRWIERRGGSLAQLMAMMMDFVPEAIALGAVFAHDRSLGFLLALFIGLQNLPESFNAYSDLRRTGNSPKRCLMTLFPLSFVGIGAALLGDQYLSESPNVVAALMLFAAGGIVYLIFDDIAPLSKMQKHRVPAVCATMGFLVGIIGEKTLG